jgi:phage terminase large subunit
MAELQVAKSFEFLLDNFSFDKSNRQEKQGFVFEGGSGSAKTWDIIQFLLYYCQVNKNKHKDILCFRQTYADLRKTVLKDFVNILYKYEMYEDSCFHKSPPVSYEYKGNIIYFTGLDSIGSHGERHDIIWGNEGMEIDYEAFRQLNQRCNEVFILDYNPYYTEHWIFNNITTRPDVKLCKTTQLDNPFLPKGQRDEILAYEPTPENINNGTADDYMWKVYGLGQRTANVGIIFKLVNWIDSFPESIRTQWGLDFGYTNDPTCLTKVGISPGNVFAEIKCYEPIDNAYAISEMLKNAGVKRHEVITADSSDRYDDFEMVKDLRDLGWNIVKVNKGKGVKWRIGLLKKNKINIVHNINAKREQENYKWREINGILINEPVDKFNHFWDSLGYGYLGMMDSNVGIVW